MNELKQLVESWKHVLFLGLGIVSAISVIISLHLVSPWLPGTAGAVFKNNMEQHINAEALFYTEVGDVTEFLNQETGRYGIDLPIRANSVPRTN